jgi:hypothetical protein
LVGLIHTIGQCVSSGKNSTILLFRPWPRGAGGERGATTRPRR